MKKILSLLSILLVTTSLYAQNIENTVGSDGDFIVKKSDGTTLFNLASTTTGIHQLRLASTTAQGFQLLNAAGTPILSFGDVYNVEELSTMIVGADAGTNWLPNGYNHIQIQSENAQNTLALFSYSNNSVSKTNNILAYLDRGAENGSSATVVDGDEILIIEGFGRTSGGIPRAARIDFEVDGDPSSGHVPGKINFWTSPGGTTDIVNNMTIKGDGTINIAGLYATTGGGGNGDKPVYVNSAGDLVAGTAVTAPNKNTNRIDQLERENQELKERLVKLEAIVEELTSN